MSLSDRNAGLMAPLAVILRASDKDAPTKVGVLVDLAGTILATLEPMWDARALRLTSEEMRKPLIQAARLHQADIAGCQEKATTALKQLREEAAKTGLSVESGVRAP